MTTVRKGQASFPMPRADFHAHYQRPFFDPAFDAEREAKGWLDPPSEMGKL